MFRLESDVPSSPAGVLVVQCSGELDLASAASLAEASGLGPSGENASTRVVIDLRAVTFFDAAALGALITLRQAATAAGRNLVMRTPSRAVTRVLTLTGMQALFEVDDVVEAA